MTSSYPSRTDGGGETSQVVKKVVIIRDVNKLELDTSRVGIYEERSPTGKKKTGLSPL